VAGGAVTLSWAAASDAQTPAAALTYNVRVGTTPGGSEVIAPQSMPDGNRLLPAPGNAGHNLSANLKNLKAGTARFYRAALP
jgi:hypothetical protein